VWWCDRRWVRCGVCGSQERGWRGRVGGVEEEEDGDGGGKGGRVEGDIGRMVGEEGEGEEEEGGEGTENGM